MDEKKFYITTTLPYVNANPHIGHALEFVQADAIARFKKLQKSEVFFNTGTDEHGIKVYNAALDASRDIHDYANEKSDVFKKLNEKLNLTDHNFIRTTDENHKNATQEFWKLCSKDIYKKKYKGKYCIGCELEKTDSELENGYCSLHPNLEIEIREEENYFFRFSNYKEKLLELYEKNPDFVIPKSRLNEIKNFLKVGANDFSISRLAEKLPWGVPVPDDPDHIMYVWFDALINYISAIGWPIDMEKFNNWWPVTQIAGKDNLRQQSAIWQAMLMSAGILQSKQILIHGFITSDGKKMSKSAGNVIDPLKMIEKYGTDAVRYYLLRHIPTFEDGDFTEGHFVEMYNAHLANGLGNLVARIMKMSEDNLDQSANFDSGGYMFLGYIKEKMDEFRIDLAMDSIWSKISELDREIQEKKPWESKDKETIKTLVKNLYNIACSVEPFMPETAKKIRETIQKNKMPKPLFKRID